eukprot:6537736-Pyramimonas_sp.AAC.1
MLSVAFLKSTAADHVGSCHSSAIPCSSDVANKWSVVLRWRRKPAWSTLCWLSNGCSRLYRSRERSLFSMGILAVGL